MNEDIKEVLFTEDQIAKRVAEMGKLVADEYRDLASDEGIVLISVLRGAAIFMADLARAIDMPIEMDFMAVSSYGNSTKSSGTVRIIKDLSTDIRGRHVVIAEDIIDSGLTLSRLLEILEEREPASLSVVAFLRKDLPDQVDITCKHIGFTCPNDFVVGYGLDYAEHYRNLPYVGILDPRVYQDER